jgi:hypothetical protein
MGCPETPVRPDYKKTLIHEDFNWIAISECFTGYTVLYSSGRVVRNSAIALLAFDSFAYLYPSPFDIEPECLCVDSVKPDGTYLGAKYWKVSISEQCRGDLDCIDIYHVSEHGDVVIFESCI